MGRGDSLVSTLAILVGFMVGRPVLLGRRQGRKQESTSIVVMIGGMGVGMGDGILGGAEGCTEGEGCPWSRAVVQQSAASMHVRLSLSDALPWAGGALRIRELWVGR